VHLILATQKPSGVVNDQIEANSTSVIMAWGGFGDEDPARDISTFLSGVRIDFSVGDSTENPG